MGDGVEEDKEFGDGLADMFKCCLFTVNEKFGGGNVMSLGIVIDKVALGNEAFVLGAFSKRNVECMDCDKN